MKTGYVALFSLLVVYSAYQGTSSLTPGSAQRESKTTRDPTQTTESARSRRSSAGTDPFPTIGGGICRLTVNGDHTPPCEDCKEICPANELRELIEDYFRADPGNDRKYLKEHWDVPHTKQGKIEFVIASLPDPVHTHMALLFDRGIESIEKAAQANGYLFSRAWMPWDISIHSESTDFTVRKAQEKLREQVESLPGLMIFQRSGDDSGVAAPILFVFVVGETPTSGLHVEQFQNALKIRQSILQDATATLPEGKTLRIYGPSFSGSLQSLDALLNAQPHDRFSTILIRSGSISSYRAVREFCESTLQQWPERIGGSESKDNRSPLGRPDFATFQFSDEYQQFYLSVFFSDRHHSHSHVAILSEDETAFGNQEKTTDTATTSAQPKSTETPGPCQAQPEPVVPFVRLYFPREIAQLRDAYQRDVKIQSADGVQSPPQNGLALSLSVTGNDDDSVASYSPLQTPLSQESILQAIVATLRKQHAKVVIIRATDPLDMIFLSRYLRQNYPQARLVTVGADVLMIHDFYDPRFHGILAVSSYPLLAGAKFPYKANSALVGNGAIDKQPKVQRLFPDSYSVGDFNALQSLLAPKAEIESSKFLPEAEYEQFGLPSFLQANNEAREHEPWRPHLWLMAIGRDGYWPVDVLDDKSLSDIEMIKKGATKPESTIREVDTATGPPSRYSVHFSVGWIGRASCRERVLRLV